MVARALEVVSDSEGEDGSREVSEARTNSVRYLYADAEPFEPNFDFITVLEGFVRMAVHALDRCKDARVVQVEEARSRANLEASEQTLQHFLDAVMSAAEQVATTPAGRDFLPERVHALQGHLAQMAESTRTELRDDGARDAAQRRQQLAGIQQDVVALVYRFFLEHALQTVRRQFRVSLAETAYEATAKEWLVGGLAVSYRLDAAAVGWESARRLGTLIEGFVLQVNTPGGWMSRSLRVKKIPVQDYTVRHLEVTDDGAQITLQRRRDGGDALTLLLTRANGATTAEVWTPDNPDQVVVVASEEKLEPLWRVCTELLQTGPSVRQAVSRIMLEDEEVFEAQHTPQLVERLVAMYAPLVREVMRRGASRSEISLKREYPDGRREEQYTSRTMLLEQIKQLSSPERELLDRLGLQGASAPAPAARSERLRPRRA